MRAQQRGWFTASDEVIPGTSLSALIAVQAHEVLLAMSSRHRIAANVRRVLGILKAFTSVSALGISLTIDVDAVSGTADTGIFSRDLRRLFIEIGQLAKQQGVGVALALDEVHSLLDDELDDLNSALHQTAQRELPVAFIGAGLFPSWQNSGGGESDPITVDSYPMRQAATTYIRLEPLGVRASMQALAEAAFREQVTYTEEALRAAVAFCKGNCWIIQLVGASAWEVAGRSPINLGDVEEAIASVRDKLNRWFFPGLLRRFSEQDIGLLRIFANRIDSGVSRLQSIGELADLADDFGGHGPSIRRSISRAARHDLIELVYTGYHISGSDGFGIRFSTPLLDDYLLGPVISSLDSPGALNEPWELPGWEIARTRDDDGGALA
jgi:hypothetical protein